MIRPDSRPTYSRCWSGGDIATRANTTIGGSAYCSSSFTFSIWGTERSYWDVLRQSVLFRAHDPYG